MLAASASWARRLAAILVAALTLAGGAAQAGPCSEDIARFEQTVRESASNTGTGPTAPQSLAAQLHRQPTFRSVADASGRAHATFEESLARAKQLDAGGNDACSTALAGARRMYLLAP